MLLAVRKGWRRVVAGNPATTSMIGVMLIQACSFTMPTLTQFYQREIGMTMLEIGMVQIFFSLVAGVVGYPAGWWADVGGRRRVSALGYGLVSVSFAGWGLAGNLTEVVTASCSCAVGLALCGGADEAMLDAACESEGVTYSRAYALLVRLRPLVGMLVFVIGGALQTRAAFWLSAVLFGIGAVGILHTPDAPPANTTTKKPDNPIRVAQSAMRNRQLAWRIAARALGCETQHSLVWIVSPMFILAGTPDQFVGAIWSANLACTYFGAKIGGQLAKSLPVWKQFTIPAGLAVLGMAIMALNQGMPTVLFYGLIGASVGWMQSISSPLVLDASKKTLQASNASLADSLGTLLVHVPTLLVVSWLAEYSFSWALWAAAAIFAVAGLIVARGLYTHGGE